MAGLLKNTISAFVRPRNAKAPRALEAADNLVCGSVRTLLRELFQGDDILIVTGYQDLLSALSIIADPDFIGLDRLAAERPLRLLFGTNLTSAQRMRTRQRSVSEEARRHYLHNRAAAVQEPADLVAIRAYDAIRSGAIAIRIFEGPPDSKTQRLFHAKLYVSELGSATGSANFSRGGLDRNIEWMQRSPAGSEANSKGREAAERFWALGTDWSEAALEILERLLKGVTPEQAVARIAAELRAFEPWKPLRTDAVGRKHQLRPYQSELVYETNATVYEHGMAIAEAPPGAGKTAIGQHVALTLAKTYAAIFDVNDPAQRGAGRWNPVVVAPPAVEAAWTDKVAGHITFIPTSRFSSRDHTIRTEIHRKVNETGVLIVDEAHNFATRWLRRGVRDGHNEDYERSIRSEQFELAPAAWTVCLSATPTGNHRIDALITMHEARAGLYVAPAFAERMDRILRDGWEMADVDGKRELRLTEEAAAAANEELARYVCRRTRHCVGEKSPEGTYPTAPFGYPTITTQELDVGATDEEVRAAEELNQVIEHWKAAHRNKHVRHEEVIERLGSVQQHAMDLMIIAAAEVQSIARVCNAAALWNIKRGGIAKYLDGYRKSRRKKPKKGAQAQSTPTANRAGGEPTSEMQWFATRPELEQLDAKRLDALEALARAHQCVVFVAARTIILQYFAEHLARRLKRSGFEVFVAGEDADGEFGRAMCRSPEPTYKALQGQKASKQLQRQFDLAATRGTTRPLKRLAFVTYHRAEGINLQAAGAVVLLGVGADVRMLRQAMGRIDRIDSPHPHITYYTLALRQISVAADARAQERLHTVRAFEHGAEEAGPHADDSTRAGAHETITRLVKQNAAPRTLRETNLFDRVRALENDLPRHARIDAKSIAHGQPWGIEVAELPGAEHATVFCLRGMTRDIRNPERSFAPPRLVLAYDNGRIVLDQAAIVHTVKEVYDRARAQGDAQRPTRWTKESTLIEKVGAGLERLTPWCLRPARTIGPLESLASFVSEGRDNATERFATLSLNALEYLSEKWIEALGPGWVEAKRSLRNQVGEDTFPSYLHCDRMLAHLRKGDALTREALQTRMEEAIAAAEAGSRGAETELWSRVAVAIRIG